MLEEGSRWNWFEDRTITACAWIAGVSGILFAARSLTYAQPVVDLRALGDRNFSLGCFLSFVTGVGIFSTIYLTPLFLGYVRGFSAWQTGIAIFSTGAASLIGVPVYVTLARKIDTRWLMMFGMASFAAAMWSFSFITHDWGADQLLIPQLLRGFPQVFAVAPAVTLGLGSLPPERLKYASGLVQHDAQSRRRSRHRGVRRHPQQPHQLAFSRHRDASDAGERRQWSNCCTAWPRAGAPLSAGRSPGMRRPYLSFGISPIAKPRPSPMPTPFARS